ncbi:MAG: ATP-binding protein, partial [Bacteriovorax sp.]
LSESTANIEIGNIVAAISDQNDDITFGSVTEMRSYSDVDSFIADYLSHDFGNGDVQVPTNIPEVVVVICNVMRNISGRTKPVEKSRVFFPSSLGIQYAYGIINADGENIFTGASIPIGIFENGDGTNAPISVDENYVVGPDGAHLNVSGISGLASKTSTIQFILKSLLAHSRQNLAVVMFNVKSRDLLFIDRPNDRLRIDQWSQDTYQLLGIESEPFNNARFFAPSDQSVPGQTQSLRRIGVNPFSWNLSMISDDIPSLFHSDDWDDKMENVWIIIQDEISHTGFVTYAQMLNWIDQQIQNAPPNGWVRGSHIATWNKMRSHLRRFPRSYEGLISTVAQGNDLPWNELDRNGVFVIDIQMLNDRGKKLVFGRAMNEISTRLESGQFNNLDAVVVFVDELNKFAPSGNFRSPIKSRLIDITARGRSIGLVLFGAEQFASSVEKEVIENSSTFLFGRTESTELQAPNYRQFSNEIKTKLSMLPQGQLLAKFAKFPQPIFMKFPFPPCASGDQITE